MQSPSTQDPAQIQASLEEILNSIGDAVLVADVQGRVTLLNPVAERLTGWTMAEASGVDVNRVLDIVPAKPRGESSVDRFLRYCERPDLANYSLLRRRDGTTVYIDDSGASVRDARGYSNGIVRVFRDISRQREAEAALRDSEEQLRDAKGRLETSMLAGEIATWNFDIVHNRVTADPNMARLFSVDPVAASGGRLETYLASIHPDDRLRVTAAIGDAAARRDEYESEYRVVLPDGSHRWLVARGKVERDSEGLALALPGVVVDITARKEAQEALREKGEFLRRLLESSRDCIKTLDLNGNILSMTDSGLRVIEADDFSVVSGKEWAQLWSVEMRETVRSAVETARSGGTGRFQGYSPTLKGTPRWWDVIVTPILDDEGKPEQLLSVSRDITDQKQIEEREHTRLTELFMSTPAFMAALSGPGHVFEMVNPPYCQLIGHRDVLGKSVAEALPEVVAQGFIELLDQVYRNGEPFIAYDHPILLQTEPGGPVEERILDFTYQPLRDVEGKVSGILAHGVDRTERKALRLKTEALLVEAQARAEREALLNQIGEAVRVTLDPEAILQAVVSALGKGLRADRCYFVRYNQTRDTAQVSPEWRRAEAQIEPLAGRILQMSAYSVDHDPNYRAGSTHVVNDVVVYAPDDAAPLLAVGVRSIMRVPIEVGDQMTALAVAMSHEPRHWTDDEVRLLENVAALVHSSLELARTQQRERNIAQQLQDALQPPPPGDSPGIALASFYRPALQEASVGGDGFDVFSISPTCTALCVFDLSGKGLKAASAVATVRNMARFALYNGATIAEAVTTLNQTIARNGLLEGFATLFLGVYDASDGSLRYANCGQEPGLIWRAASGAVEMLPPTGPVMGGFIEGQFSQETVTLAPGDLFFCATDGMTEVGPNRRAFLTIDGLASLFGRCAADAAETEATPKVVAESVVRCLIDGVEAHAGGEDGLRDDIALLVGVVAS